MTGAKLQLYSIGKENSYLTNNPQISFFKQSNLHALKDLSFQLE